jgi:hypothetical protein
MMIYFKGHPLTLVYEALEIGERIIVTLSDGQATFTKTYTVVEHEFPPPASTHVILRDDNPNDNYCLRQLDGTVDPEARLWLSSYVIIGHAPVYGSTCNWYQMMIPDTQKIISVEEFIPANQPCWEGA